MTRIFCIAFMGFVLLCVGCHAPEELGHPLLGKPMSQMFYQRLDGSDIPLYVYQDGRVTLVNFWNTDCAPCKKELMLLEKIATLGKGDVQVLAISTDRYMPRLQAYLDANPMKNVRVLRDPGFYRTVRDLGLELPIPTTLLLNADMGVVAVEEGERSWDSPEMLALIRSAAQTSTPKGK